MPLDQRFRQPPGPGQDQVYQTLVRTIDELRKGVPNGAVENAQLADMAQSTIKGRAAGAGTGDPQDLTATQATAILNAVVGDSGAGGTKGLVPAPGAGDAAAGKFLKADGTFAAPTGAFTGSSMFFAYNSVTDANVTGNGAVYTHDFDTELVDTGNEFATDTHTPAVTGHYSYGGCVTFNTMTNSTVAETTVVTSNRTYLVANLQMVSGTTVYVWPWSVLVADMDAGDTMVVKTTISGGTGNNADSLGGVASTVYTYVCGYRIK